MNRSVYTTASHKALASGLAPEQVLSGLQKTLARHGHLSLYGMILKDLSKLLEKEEEYATATMLVAKADDAEKYRGAVAEFVGVAKARHTKVVVDETLVGGFTLKTATHKRDQSYKESLVSMYRSLTAH